MNTPAPSVIHAVSHRDNPPPAGADGNMASTTPVCSCGWEGFAVHDYNDDQVSTLARQAKSHHNEVARQRMAADAAHQASGWHGVGTFGEVGPTATLRQAIVRSGV
jgi:hypothetical protein